MKSWVETANAPECDFPIQNLPYGVFRTPGSAFRCGAAIGDFVVDLAALEAEGLISAGEGPKVFSRANLNGLMERGPDVWQHVRDQLTDLVREGGNPAISSSDERRGQMLFAIQDVELALPVEVRGYTDFYASRQHAQNVGTMFRGAENALPPNWLHIPIGYNGRASTVVVSGSDIHRPLGQRKPPQSEEPLFGPCTRLDYELELGAIVGVGNEMGQPVSVAQADRMIFGYVLLNDWSARDIQSWEYQPLGPFQAKVFATTISPWIVTRAALEGFRVSTPPREKPLLPYLREPGPTLYDINLTVSLQPEGQEQATVLTRTNFRHMYYSSPQQLAHHAIGGCLMQTGDLLGSGTISGPTREEFGSLLELSWNGSQPVPLVSGGERTFIEDGDRVSMTGFAQGDGYRIGFGPCEGVVLPAPKLAA